MLFSQWKGFRLLVFGILFGVEAATCQPPTQERTLQLAGKFDLIDALKAHSITSGAVEEMRAVGPSLFFLIQHDPNGSRSIVRTDLRGTVQMVVSLGGVDVIDWTVENDLAIAADVETPDGKLREVRRYNAGGAQEHPDRATELKDAPLRITRHGGVTRGGNRVRVAWGAIPLKHPNSFVTTCLTLPGDRAVIVDGIDADATLVDLRTGQSTLEKLDHPEIARIKERSRMEGKEGVLAILAATVDRAGNIYCMLSGFRPQDGAPVVVLNPDGDRKTQMRCPIVPGVHGPTVPAAIAVVNDEFFVTDRLGQVSAFHLAR